ncbi:major facilitator superfamily domain-containing protein [Umbelopsis sp. PMI_123]|nr:major facilitator superfamily domain-containing protein [Umbelopsis sp. PMI_123]
MSDETNSSKTRIEEDLIVNIGQGTDLVAVTELQSGVISNENTSGPSSVYSDNEKTTSIASHPSLKQEDVEPVSISPEDSAVQKPVKAKKAWWRGRSSNLDVDPKSYSNKKKISITAIIALAGSISPISSTIYYPALVTVQEALNTSATAINASLSIFTFFTAFFPLMWASFGDTYGRRNIYLISFSVYVVGSIGCALSVNITMLIVFRAFSAIGSSSVMSLGAGTISDIYYPHERGRAFSMYTCGPLLGPALGPIIGGYLNEGLGWRSTFWFLVIFSFLLLCGIFFLLPETFRPGPPTQKLPTTNEKEQQGDTTNPTPTPKRRRVNPLQALDILRFKNIQLVVTFVAFTFMFFYLINTTFTRTYTLQYGLSSGIVGLCYFPQAIGAMAGGIFGGRYSDRLYRSRVAKANGESWPEQRLGGWVMWASIFIESCAFIAYGWCVKMNVHFAWGLVCQFFRKCANE